MPGIEFHKTRLPDGEMYGYLNYPGGEKTIVLICGNLASSRFFQDLSREIVAGLYWI